MVMTGARHRGVLGLRPSKVTAESVGLNHGIWMIEFGYEGEDAYPLIDEWIATQRRSTGRTTSRIQRQPDVAGRDRAVPAYGLMPIGDTPRNGGWWFHADLETKRYWYGAPLGGFDSEIGLAASTSSASTSG